MYALCGQTIDPKQYGTWIRLTICNHKSNIPLLWSKKMITPDTYLILTNHKQ